MKDEPVVAINSGSSSVKFSVFDVGTGDPRLHVRGSIDRIGLDGTTMRIAEPGAAPSTIPIGAGTSHREVAPTLISWLDERLEGRKIKGIGHRVVNGGLHLSEHQVITAEVVGELKRMEPLDLAHLPREIAMIEAFASHFAGIPQVACFDTAFHRELPRVAQMLPIPRRYDQAGIRRLGFHGLSYTYLMGELAKIGAAGGKIVLAHLGSGASMAAVRDGKPLDTTMSFTAMAGLVMGTRCGDLDPGFLVYLMKDEKLTVDQADDFISRQCGLLGVSETSPDMHELLERRRSDERAAEAVDLFCYQARKQIGAYAAAMNGIDTLVFAGGIGEHSPEVRAEICAGLDFLGLRLDQIGNSANAATISSSDSRLAARVIPTDEEIVIAEIVAWLAR